ncbi:hypothetical protein EDD16DRAFT_1526675 [Pisolithus croceorrhizus]|nr:hypothetical protein EDD16DRAFT_1526675 [Pisolithus croceorrhizus]KAI6142528.1 hypothetical protein EDD17DRAFT_1515737 [Pisolithus thermaeus]
MAMDYLPIQGSTVPCKWILSSSMETDTKKWNRIKPALMEALQMLKFHQKKSHLNFMKGLLLDEEDLYDDSEDILAMLLSRNLECMENSLEKILQTLGRGKKESWHLGQEDGEYLQQLEYNGGGTRDEEETDAEEAI